MADKKGMRFVLREWQEREVPHTIARDCEFKRLLEADEIIDILGARRSGKTFFMYHVINTLLANVPKEAIVYVNFEDRRLHPLTPKTLDCLLEVIYENEPLEKHGRVYLFLDEIQNVPEWERFARNLYDSEKGRIKLFVSGSSSKLGKKELAGLLTGRHLTINMFPLSFCEFLRFKGLETAKIEYSDKNIARTSKLLREYLEFGGFPQVALSNLKKELLAEYFEDILYRDVIERYNLRERTTVENTAKYLITNVSSYASVGKIASFFNSMGMKASTATISSYLKILEDVFLIFAMPILSYKIKDRLQYPRKIYGIDTGLRNAVSFRFSEDWGRLAENAVFLELKRRGFEPHYWKDQQQREVDFVVKEGMKIKQIIQVCWNISEPETKKRETHALLAGMEEFKIKKGMVLTEDYERDEKTGGKTIRYQPLWKWLLGL